MSLRYDDREGKWRYVGAFLNDGDLKYRNDHLPGSDRRNFNDIYPEANREYFKLLETFPNGKASYSGFETRPYDSPSLAYKETMKVAKKVNAVIEKMMA